MTLHTFPDVEQGTPEWLELRRGILTASTVGQLITPSLKPASNQAARSLTLTLVAERLSGHIDQVFVSDDMLRGQMEEPLARNLYAEFTGVEVSELGFMTEDKWGPMIGYSPDGLVGDEGLIEIKSRRQKKQLRTILDGQVPAENMAQIQCGLLVSGRKWCDYVSFCGGMPLFIKRVYPDNTFQHAVIEAAIAFEHAAADMTRAFTNRTAGYPVPPRSDIEQEIQIS